MHQTVHRDVGVYIARQNGLDPERLGFFSAEPDFITSPLPQLWEHAIRVEASLRKKVAQATQQLRERNPEWLRTLGHALHYTADMGTPHHVSPAIPMAAGIGALIGGMAAGGKGAGAGAGIGGGITAWVFKRAHDRYEQVFAALHEEEFPRLTDHPFREVDSLDDRILRMRTLERPLTVPNRDHYRARMKEILHTAQSATNAVLAGSGRTSFHGI